MHGPLDETPAGTGELARERTYTLVELTGAHRGRRHRVGDEALLGRANDADVPLSGRDVSRNHARIRRMVEGGFRIEDLKSRHGTRVNGVPVTDAPLNPGDRVTVGNHTLLLFTQQDPAEEQLFQAQKMEALGRLAGGIAHDFNNLLGAALNNLAALKRMGPDTALGTPDVQETLADTRSALERVADLTRHLVGFAQLGKLHERSVSLAKLVDEVSRLVTRSAQPAPNLVRELQPDLHVRGDASQLLQVLLNICINARDAVASNRGRIVVRARRAKPADLKVLPAAPAVDMVLLEVEDNGVGMDPAIQARAFEPFFSTKGPGRGSGLGLATVYGIVTNHGGHVSVESASGVGTTVRVLLPAAAASGAVARSTEVPPPETGSARILVVDDEDLYRTSAARYLRHLGYVVTEARGGVEALAQVEDETPDLVLLDMLMPDMDGQATYAALREKCPDLLVILATGFADEEGTEALLRAGAVGCLTKPYDAVQLCHEIEQALSVLK
ncbi:MAG: response regulator [Myxococcales bacterium]|nr:response regulator [Myxococcales bacterium]